MNFISFRNSEVTVYGLDEYGSTIGMDINNSLPHNVQIGFGPKSVSSYYIGTGYLTSEHKICYSPPFTTQQNNAHSSA